MREFLQTANGRVVVGGLLITSAIALASWLYPLGQQKRALDVSVSQNVELTASPALSKSGALRFTYNDQQVPNLVSTKIRLKNSGGVPIQKGDFIANLDVSFPNDTRIVNYSLTQTQPLKDTRSIQQGVLEKRDNNHLLFTPVLINPNEVFDIDILTTREGFRETQSLSYHPDEISFDYKIYGITSIHRVPKIETNAERHTISRQTVDGWIAKIPIALVVILLFGLAISYITSLPKRLKNTNEPSKQGSKTGETIFFIVMWGFILIVILYALGKIFYEAYIL